MHKGRLLHSNNVHTWFRLAKTFMALCGSLSVGIFLAVELETTRCRNVSNIAETQMLLAIIHEMLLNFIRMLWFDLCVCVCVCVCACVRACVRVCVTDS